MDSLNHFREQQIQKILNEMSSNYYEIENRNEIYSFQSDQEKPDLDYEMYTESLEDHFTDNAKTVYLLICSYIEGKGELEYLKHFKNIISPKLETKAETLSSAYDSYNQEHYCVILSEIWNFLRTYEFFGQKNDEYLLKRTGITYLENILENTAVIVKDLDKVPKSETEVYNAVKVVCKGVFPNANYPTSPFLSIAQEYKPDILLPSLNTAIEYKYARTEEKLKATIDQILVDVAGYSNHTTYKLFYAVFYVTSDFWGRKKFNEIWKEKGFPKNWIGIYVVGN
ncbi:PD-(D/E)XK nuclease domain-containing protein [Flavobacterium hibernum]|uniref:Uncharacterized protein n=1 Tax=Flavobacterium hibernum TaxID=37752 RepID=A0ABX4C6K8_9FLAO|nr:hypothetical protein [Flavobacterium hibernum]OXA88174.1 hypothetical protein B0A73_10415 [Flavobacterium hibernum]STO10799.1 Uncharacterised protein [Flavobacterium hibernum]